MGTKKTIKTKPQKKKGSTSDDTPLLVASRAELKKLKEIPFCKRVLVPLFEAMKYRDVRFMGGGVLEQGKDITMWETNALDQRSNIAVVAKVGKITGSVKSVGEVVTQVQQCFGSPFFDHAGPEPRHIHRCIVVTNDEITKEGATALKHALKGASIAEDRVTPMDIVDLWPLLQKHRSQIALLGTMKEAYDTLNTSDPDYALELTFTQDGVQQAVVAKRKDVLPLKLSFTAQFPADEAGKNKLAEFEEFMRSGGTFTLEPQFVGKLELPPIMGGYAPHAGGFQLSFSPAANKRTRMSITTVPVVGEPVTIPFVDFRSVINGVGQVQLVNDEQNVPYRFTITFEEPKRAIIEYTFEFARGKFAAALLALRFQEAFADGGSMVLRDLEDEIEERSNVPAGVIERPHPGLIDLVRKAVEIEKRLDVRFTVPRTFFTVDDAKQILLIHHIVTTGRVLSQENAVVEMEVSNAPKFLKLLQGDVSLVSPGIPVRMFGQLIDLGEVRATIPAVKVHPTDVERIRKMSDDDLERPVKLRLIAGGGAPIRTEYPKWIQHVE